MTAEGSAVLTNVIATGNEVGISVSRRLTGTGIVASDNRGIGIVASGPLRVWGLTASDNEQPGIVAWRSVRLEDATLTGNAGTRFGVDAVDILSRRRPRAAGLACDHSLRFSIVRFQVVLHSPWSLCTGD
jgi:hypothetical protein